MPGTEVRPFDQGIVAEFGNTAAANYLHDYLHELQALSVLHEQSYVDRHYLDEYAQYYATSFLTPPPKCQRYHFFSVPPEELERLLTLAFEGGEHVRVQKEVEERGWYLGFVVRRPLGAAPIGRTVLRTYPVAGRRRYQAMRPYRVHLCGLSLRIDGLAYQQQDGGAAVCASVALWTALQGAANMAGNRTPTPIAITAASGTPFPAGAGLLLPQMATAISKLGYLAETFAPGPNRADFRAKLVACLDSHLPVVLLLSKTEPSAVSPEAGDVTVGHAVTLTGYSDPPQVVEVLPTVASIGQPIAMRGASVEFVYVHDDNLGSHAHYELLDVTERNEDGHQILRVLRGRSDAPPKPWWPPDKWDVLAALVCKPPKLRTSIEDLFADIRFVRPLVEQVILPGLQVHYSARFSSGVGLKRDVLELPVDRQQVRQFQMMASFPRHVGVVGVHRGDLHVCDLILDASQVRRDPAIPLLAIVAPGIEHGSRAWVNLQALAPIPIITAPAKRAAQGSP